MKELSDLGGGDWKGSKNPFDGSGGGINGGGGGGGGAWNGPGPGPGGTAVADGGGEILLLLLPVGFCMSLNRFNQFLKA